MKFDQQNRGRVILVGAGPGDPELLTLKAVRALQAADIVLVDDLVNPAVLQYANPKARIIPVGKRGGCKSTPQSFIEHLMCEEAHAGRQVIRLKGGDPFIFGRGGEEWENLVAAGIQVEVINGITSGIAAPSLLGIPLTHRNLSQGAIFVTGHGKDITTQPNWKALVETGMALVIYMGVARSQTIQHALLDAGMRQDMPIAIIQSATLPEQRGVLTRLELLAETIQQKQLHSPSIIIVGEVVNCADAALLLEKDSPQVIPATGTSN